MGTDIREKLVIAWEKIVAWMEKHYKIIVFLALLAFFIKSFLNGLLSGEGWVLYQPIAMADRFLNGQGFYYSGTEASTPYFPGVAFLAVVIGKLFNPWRDYVMLIIASLIGTIFYYMLIWLGTKISGNRWVSLVVTTGLIFSGFISYKWYMYKFKADSAVLVLGGVLVWLIERCETDKRRINIKYLLLMFVTAFVMDVTKQQALYIDFALGIYLVFTKKFNVIEKVKILASLILAGIVDIIVIFSIPGLEITAIKNLKNMPYHTLSTIIEHTTETVLTNIVCVVILVAMFIIWIFKKVKLSSLANKWLLVSVLFFAGQTLGGWKEGGNSGNYEVGLVCFLPFAVLCVTYFLKNYIVKEKQRDVVMLCSLVIAVMMICMACLLPLKDASDVADTINSDTAVSEYLSEVADGKTVLYNSNWYMPIAKSTALPGLDLATVPVYLEEYDDVVTDSIVNQTNDFIYANKGLFDDNTQKLLEENYTLVKDPDMPKSMQNRFWIAKRLK